MELRAQPAMLPITSTDACAGVGVGVGACVGVGIGCVSEFVRGAADEDAAAFCFGLGMFGVSRSGMDS